MCVRTVSDRPLVMRVLQKFNTVTALHQLTLTARSLLADFGNKPRVTVQMEQRADIGPSLNGPTDGRFSRSLSWWSHGAWVQVGASKKSKRRLESTCTFIYIGNVTG